MRLPFGLSHADAFIVGGALHLSLVVFLYFGGLTNKGVALVHEHLANVAVGIRKVVSLNGFVVGFQATDVSQVINRIILVHYAAEIVVADAGFGFHSQIPEQVRLLRTAQVGVHVFEQHLPARFAFEQLLVRMQPVVVALDALFIVGYDLLARDAHLLVFIVLPFALNFVGAL